ncbi:MAG: succinylglutamate desuccinylase/aspartoacylase family protein [Acidobacteriota bacterium]|nr:succinylglutamate desuccinylase/aspartoacylase family protein [Acidobacteriota bacterium]
MTLTNAVSDAPVPIREGQTRLYPRVLGDLGSGDAGRTLLCVAALHGNEPAGAQALEKVFSKLAARPDQLTGRFVGLVGNRRALAAGQRFLVEDLNRAWFPERLEKLEQQEQPGEAEAAELLELSRAVHGVLSETLDLESIFCLDLHTTSGPGPTFSVLNDTLPNRRFARAFPVPVVLGLEEELGGTLANYLADLGVRMLGFESGQHHDPTSVDRAEAAIWIALGLTGLLDRQQHPEVGASWDRLSAESAGLPRAVEVRHRHAIDSGNGFRMRPGFESFQPIAKGAELGIDHDGPVRAREDGLILMPLYQKLGEDGFFIIRKVQPAWLQVSTAMRHLRLERVLHWLPGVRRHPDLPETFVVNRRIARWRAPELFHLLGFRRLRTSKTHLTLARRLHDT